MGLLLDARSGGLALLSGSIGALALVTLAIALLFGRPALLGWALAVVFLQYLERLVATGETGLWLPAAVGVGALLVGELGQWSFDSRSLARGQRGLHLGRAMAILSLATLGAVTTVVCLLAVAAPMPRDRWTAAAAIVAIVVTVALVARAARSDDVAATSGRSPTA